jgi:hypothetical protein
MEEKIKCLYCSEEILSIAKKYKHCGEWLAQPHARLNSVPDEDGTEKLELLSRIKSNSSKSNTR